MNFKCCNRSCAVWRSCHGSTFTEFETTEGPNQDQGRPSDSWLLTFIRLFVFLNVDLATSGYVFEDDAIMSLHHNVFALLMCVFKAAEILDFTFGIREAYTTSQKFGVATYGEYDTFF